ncbi:MAG TPA: O-antigen ligase family protein [Bacteroidales bacterium]|nr:O-antigen ligase family protein [Bacteroidales bacterium]
MPLLKKEYHTFIYVLALMTLAFSLTLSLYVMSIAQFVLLANWLAEGNIIGKFSAFFRNKPALVFTGIYLLHLAGLCCTYDFANALDELRIKLPLLILPVIISTGPQLSRKTFNLILLFHIAGTFISGIISFYLFQSRPVSDMRDIFIFISHIRYSLNVCVDIFILLYFIFSPDSFKKPLKIFFALLAGWFVYFLLFMESFTGITVLIIASAVILILFIVKNSSPLYKILFFIVMLAVISGTSLYVWNTYNDFKNIDPINPQALGQFTRYGNPYVHDTKNRMTDNGNYTWLYVCDPEMEEAWNKRSRIRYDSVDQSNSPLRFTLVRFLTSKGLKKDMDGVNSLSDEEITLIENGVANIDYVKKGSFENRLKNAIWEYENYKITHDPRGQSMMQRLELWSTSWTLFKNHFWIGLGTGDVKNVFAAKLVVDDSLLKKSGLRPHNQYLTFMLEFGIFGFLFFVFCLCLPAIRQKKFSDFLYLSFFVIAFVSMCTEDTLETQAGVTFFTCFSCLFLFIHKNNKSEKKQ